MPAPSRPVHPTLFRITQGFYYLALGTWFGAVVMMGAAAGLTFSTLRNTPLADTQGPATLPDLAPRAADFVAGNVVNRTFGVLTVVQGACAAVLVAAVILQATALRGSLARFGKTWPNALRVALVALGLALFLTDLGLTRPRMTGLRTAMYDEAATADDRARARDAFDALHERSSRSLGISAVLMAAAALASPFAFAPASPTREEIGHG